MQPIRTGARSVWFELSRAGPTTFPAVPRSEQSSGKYDVAVIGGGLAGLSTASSLIEAGIKKVAVLEALQVGKGVTGYSTAKITSQHNLIYADLESKFGEKTAKIYADLNQAGVKYIVETAQKYSIECDLSKQPAYTYTLQQSYVDQLKKESEVASKCGIPSSFVEATTQTSLPYNILGAVRFEDQAQFNSYDYCVGLSKALAQKGVDVFENSRVTDVEHLKGPHVVKTAEGGSIEADYVVLTTHLPFLDRSGHFGFCEPICSYVVAFRGKEKQFPDGMWVSAEEPKRSIRSCYNGSVLVIGGNGHSMGEEPGSNNENATKEIEEWTLKNFGQLEKICSWMAHDYRPADRLPYIGYLHRGCDTMFTATGFQKWGISLGAASGRIITDLILNKGQSSPTSPWHEVVDARRWDIVHGAPQLIKNQAHVTKHLVGDKVKAAMHAVDIEDLAKGNGGICKNKSNTQVAAYRDESGQLYQVSPVCTHLGCHVGWNQNDKTWDCPCHGSRFNYDGQVIHGPAVHPLKKVEEAH